MADELRNPENNSEVNIPAGSGQSLTLLETIIDKGKMARDDIQRTYARDLIGEFVIQVLDNGIVVSSDTVAMINSRIAQIDELLTNQLNEILHDAEFQKLEASWR